MKLHQLVAIEKERTARLNRYSTEMYHTIQNKNNYFGLTKDYTPDDEDGEQLPSESKRVTRKLMDDLDSFLQHTQDIVEFNLQKDKANCNAVANLVVEGELLLENVPVTTLLSLEKKMQHYRTVLNHLPVLTEGQFWQEDKANDRYITDLVKTSKTKKVEKPLVMYEATDKHPAQVKTTNIDLKVGTWAKRDISTAIPSSQKKKLIQKADRMIDAIKQAREEANSIEVGPEESADKMFNYLVNI